ncbi:MAG: aminotransferase class III-fold pyridoxal phosphate-dependent enzyme, partial [Pseudomonadota bacterium]|nr:aminotransferase class III-fold pyridoxal phosphate-dependent enzyme [Pseudomonadota bacterium]
GQSNWSCWTCSPLTASLDRCIGAYAIELFAKGYCGFGTFYQSSSYTANPLACAAAVANLAIWREEPVRERVAKLAEKQQTHLDALSGHAILRNARRCGTIAALEVGDPAGSYLSELGPRLLRRFREAELLLRPLGNTVYVMPPYCIEDEDLARIWAEIGAAADDLATQ